MVLYNCVFVVYFYTPVYNLPSLLKHSKQLCLKCVWLPLIKFPLHTYLFIYTLYTTWWSILFQKQFLRNYFLILINISLTIDNHLVAILLEHLLSLNTFKNNQCLLEMYSCKNIVSEKMEKWSDYQKLFDNHPIKSLCDTSHWLIYWTEFRPYFTFWIYSYIWKDITTSFIVSKIVGR